MGNRYDMLEDSIDEYDVENTRPARMILDRPYKPILGHVRNKGMSYIDARNLHEETVYHFTKNDLEEWTGDFPIMTWWEGYDWMVANEYGWDMNNIPDLTTRDSGEYGKIYAEAPYQKWEAKRIDYWRKEFFNNLSVFRLEEWKNRTFIR
jgi:hypothetical protein